MKRRGALACLSAAFLIGRPAHGQLSAINLANFVAANTGEDALPGLNAAINSLPKQGALLTIPPGVYQVGHGDPAQLHFANFQGLTIQAGGAEFQFANPRSGLAFHDSNDVSLHGLTIDWPVPQSSHAIVRQADAEGRWAVLDLVGASDALARRPIRTIALREPGRAALHWDIVYGRQIGSSSVVAPGMLQLDFNGPTKLRLDQSLVVRFDIPGDHVLDFVRCRGVSVTDTTIWAGPSMGLTAGGCADVHLRNLAVVPKPGHGRVMSTNADGVHLGACKGTLVIENCSFALMGDDAVNVAYSFMHLDVAADRRSARCRPWQDRKLPRYALPDAGERVTLIDGATLQVWSHATIAAVDDAVEWNVRFTNALPESPPELLYAIGESEPHVLRVSGCSFKSNRARGILAHNDAVIENCTFADQGLEAVLLCPDLWWQEGPSVANVTLRGNSITRSGQSATIKGAITVTAFVGEYPAPHRETTAQVNHQISVISNRIFDPGSAAVYVSATTGLTVRDNVIESAEPSAITLVGVQDAIIAGNRCTPARAIELLKSEPGSISFGVNEGLSILSTP